MADASNWSNIRAKIAEILEGISGVGSVYEGPQLKRSWKEFIEAFKDDTTGSIHAWTIQLGPTRENRLSNRQLARELEFTLRYYRSFDQANDSETDFQTHTEAAADAFRDYFTLGETAEYCDPLQIRIRQERMFGSTLVHYAECLLTAYERLDGGTN
jgi:hypothetical protein